MNFHILIRLNVSKENYSDVENFLVTDAQLFKRDKRFQLLFRNVGDWGCGDRKEGYEVKRFAEDVSFELSQKAINKDTIYLITYCLEVISMPAMLKKSIPTPLIQKETF